MNLRNIVEGINGCEFVTIDSITEVKLLGGRANPLQGRVTKRVTGSNVMIFANLHKNGYNEIVKRRLGNEGKDPESFQLSPRKWGVRETGLPFVHHNEREYIEVIFMRAGEVEYLVDGVPFTGDIQGLSRSQGAEQGGLDNKVIIRTYMVNSITTITCRGNRFILDSNVVTALAA